MTSEITSKQQMYALKFRHAFGNTLRTWRTERALLDSGFTGHLGLRCVGKPGGPFVHPLTVVQALKAAPQLRARGYTVLFCEAAPDHLITIQGEFADYSDGYWLTYSRQKSNMRIAMQHPQHACGRYAEMLVHSNVSAADWEDFLALFEKWPEHVLEFTAFETPVGQLRGRHAVVWELRQKPASWGY
jgi:hypothetical protein